MVYKNVPCNDGEAHRPQGSISRFLSGMEAQAEEQGEFPVRQESSRSAPAGPFPPGGTAEGARRPGPAPPGAAPPGAAARSAARQVKKLLPLPLASSSATKKPNKTTHGLALCYRETGFASSAELKSYAHLGSQPGSQQKLPKSRNQMNCNPCLCKQDQFRESI